MAPPPPLSNGLGDLRRILHNIDDHTQVLHKLFTDGELAQPFRAELLAHIRYEEAENQRQLLTLQAQHDLPSYEIETLIQHSRLLAVLTEDGESDPGLVAEILHHFAEEHEWFSETLSGLAGSSASPAPRRSTVGSLLDRG